ncbi:unnamed protein product, partial [Mesorhabditis spiculigera]
MHGLGFVLLVTIGIAAVGLVQGTSEVSWEDVPKEPIEIAAGTEKAIQEGVICQACERIVAAVEAEATTQIDTEVRKYINIMCDKVPFENIKKQCLKTLNGLIDQLVVYIKDRKAPKVACKAVGLCKGGQLCLPN